MKRVFVLVAFFAMMLIAADAQALYWGPTYRVTTADPGGGDAELRESQPTTARGDSTEIASRVASNRNSLIYLKFGVQDITAAQLADGITVRTTYRNNNLSAGRIEDSVGGANTGFDYFVLDPTADGADWDEGTLTPSNAPGYNYDGTFETKPTYDYDPLLGTRTPHSDLSYLGEKLYDSAELMGGHLPVGGAFDFVCNPGSALHSAIVEAQATAHQTVTIVMGIAHENDNANINWLGFNYLFNPKEQTTLNDDPDSPWGGMSNADNDFSPALFFVPEPATLALLGLGGLLLRRKT